VRRREGPRGLGGLVGHEHERGGQQWYVRPKERMNERGSEAGVVGTETRSAAHGSSLDCPVVPPLTVCLTHPPSP
jgi:hypothetical protein